MIAASDVLDGTTIETIAASVVRIAMVATIQAKTTMKPRYLPPDSTAYPNSLYRILAHVPFFPP